MGEKITELRNELGLTQQELGHKLVPPVNRGAINKWEKGKVKNIKRTYVEQLSVLFEKEPIELMCFESRFNEEQISKEAKIFEKVQEHFGKDAFELLKGFLELNESGRQKILNDMNDLSQLSKYTD